VFDWGHYYALVRQAVRAELLAGLAILMCEHLGTSKIEAVQTRLAKIIAFQQTTYAHVLAAEDQGFYTPGGLFKPDIQLFNWGRVYFLQNYGAIVNELIDLCGRSAIMFPTAIAIHIKYELRTVRPSAFTRWPISRARN
jgi:3,5,6-trichloropyridin-2-ol/2,4,6-trichlorophenol monooxygenase